MDIIKKAADALAQIAEEGTPVQQGWYDASLHKTHITLWALGNTTAGHSDDEDEIEAGNIQVTIFSTEDEVDLAQRIRKLMVAAGFTWTAGDQDDTMDDGGVFLKPQRFNYMEEMI